MRHRRWITSLTTTLGIVLTLVLHLSAQPHAWGAVGSFAPPSNVVAEVNPDLYRYEIQRIGILPFVNQSGTPDAGMRLASLFYTELESYERFDVSPPVPLDEESELAFTRTAQVTSEDERPGRLRQFVREWMSRLWPASSEAQSETSTAPSPAEPSQTTRPLDAVLTGVITRYHDRQGNALLVDQPASVAYEAFLISAHDGEILWRARFDETQKPLLDNLLLAERFFKGGGGWQTNDTLARIGLERVVKTFPGIAARALP